MQLIRAKRLTTLLFGPLVLAGCGGAGQIDTTALDEQARDLTQRFVGTLLPTLQNAMASGGPVAAIAVCSQRAPEIAAELSTDSGWSVRRVSLRPRNVGSATPDSWERQTLEDFARRQQAGAAGGAINRAAIVDGEYRYMQAQPTMPLCLPCHGQNLSADVRTALAQHYPDDMATGYAAGEIRGAISLRTPLP